MDNNEKRIWHVDKSYHCPIVGYCLDREEQASVVRKSAKGLEKELSDIELHEYLVSEISRESPLASRVERLLDAKYAKTVTAYRNSGFEEWLKMGDELLSPEGFGSYIWVAAKYHSFGATEDAVIYGKIHMYTHDMRNDLQRSRAQSAALAKENTRYKDSITELKLRHKADTKEIIELRKSLRMTQTRTTAERSKPQASSAHDPSRLALEAEITALREENRRLRKAERDSTEWLDKIKRELAEFYTAMRNAPNQGLAGSGACHHAGECDLCARRVLVVGGLSRLKEFYRDIVRTMNGSFLYHDGDCHNSASGLPELIDQADVVLCSLDVNSHAACLRVKKNCKESGKAYYMLRKSSVSSVYETLVKVAGERGIPGQGQKADRP